MKVTKKLQREYLSCLKTHDLEGFKNLYAKFNEPFIPMYLVSHGLLNLEAALNLPSEGIKETVRLWDLGFTSQDKTFVIWLLEARTRSLVSPSSTIRSLFEYGFEILGDKTHSYLITKVINRDASLGILVSLRGYFHRFSPRILEAHGVNVFLWQLRYGSEEDIKKAYYPGAEFLKDHAGHKVLCFLPESKANLREFFFKNSKILEDPEFTDLGIKLDENSYLPRPYQGLVFPLINGDLKLSLGVNSKLFLDTLREHCSFPISPQSKGREYTLDYFNALYIIKKKLPEVDENILHNALKEVINGKVKHLALNIESLEEIIDLSWDALSRYSEKRRLKILISNYQSLSSIQDIVSMINSKAKMATELGIDILPEKPKNFQDLHDYLAKIPEVLEINREFKQPFSLELDNYTRDSLRLSFPKKESDLILIGTRLSNCVGSERYRDAVCLNESQILTIYDNEVLKVCIELKVINQSSGVLVSVEQILGKQNQAVEQKYFEFLYHAVKEKFPTYHLSFPCRLPNEQDYFYE